MLKISVFASSAMTRRRRSFSWSVGTYVCALDATKPTTWLNAFCAESPQEGRMFSVVTLPKETEVSQPRLKVMRVL